MYRLLSALVTIVILLGGCAGSSASGGPAPSDSSPDARRTSQPSRTSAPSADALLAVAMPGGNGVRVIRASTAEAFVDLGAGAPADARWGQWLSLAAKDGRTSLGIETVGSGTAPRSLSIEGQWRLPTVGRDPLPVGLSTDGRTLALVDAAPPAGVSRFALVDVAELYHAAVGLVSVSEVVQVVDLPGVFDFDALSPDGRTLYVVEHLSPEAGGTYQVRKVARANGKLDPAVIADKRNLDEAMAGYPISQLRVEDGDVLTLYRGPKHPFVHALNTRDGWAVCIDLPASRAGDDLAARDWGLALAPDGDTAYAANATLGLIAEIDLSELTIRRTATIEPLAAAAVSAALAKFGHEAGGPVAARVLLSPDGRTIYAAGAGGILAIDARTLATTGRFPVGAIEGLGLRQDGSILFALTGADGQIVGLDARTGAVRVEVPGSGYEGLLAVVPW